MSTLNGVTFRKFLVTFSNIEEGF